MQRLEVSGAVRLIYRSLGVKGLKTELKLSLYTSRTQNRNVGLAPLILNLGIGGE